MANKTIRIGLASLRHPASVAEGLKKVEAAIAESAAQKVDILCFPETYIPGLRGAFPDLTPPDQNAEEKALLVIRSLARTYGVAVIIGMEWKGEGGLLNLAFVISRAGRVLGHQAKNQITPDSEEKHYVPDAKRAVFTLDGVKVGVVICHEGWRYPETVRWAATRGARIVFHPQCTGDDDVGPRVRKKWGDSFYEKAMICRAHENSIYFASVNTAMRSQNSATSLISPSGVCLAFVPYGKEQVLIREIDLKTASLRYAKRYRPDLYPA